MRPRYKLSKHIVDGLWDLLVLLKYPKIMLLAISVLLAYALFRTDSVQSFFHGLEGFGYVSSFFGGMLFAFGFGAPFGVAILATIADEVNILIGGILGGLGALLSDYLLFKFIRVTFADEIERLKNSRSFELFRGLLVRRAPSKMGFYISLGIAGLVIASPLPDEFGVALLAGITTVKETTFAVVAFSLNTLGILVVMSLGLAM